MKYIFFIIVAFLLVQEIPAQIRLSTMDSVTTFTPTDLFWLNTKPSSAFVNRKVSWRSLRSNIEDFMADSTHTWALPQTFSNGATFSASSSAYGGSVTFADTVVSSHAMTGKLYLPYDATSQVGIPGSPMFRVSTKSLVLYNTESNDSSLMTYDDSTLTFTKNIRLSDSTLTIGSSVTGGHFRSISVDSVRNNYQVNVNSVYSNVRTSSPLSYRAQVVALDTSTHSIAVTGSSILLDASNTARIDTMTMSKSLANAYDFTPVYILNVSAYDVIFTDTGGAGFDGCLRLAGSDTLGTNDALILMYYPNVSKWFELSRSNN